MIPFLGQLQAFGFNFAPVGWAFCNGQVLAITSNTPLFSLLGTTFGGDGRTTFALPDLRGRSIVHSGQGPGFSFVSQGQAGGREQLTITVQNMPAHNHNGNFRLGTGLGNTATAVNNGLAASAGSDTIYTPGTLGSDTLAAGSIAIDNAGGGQPVAGRNPYTGIYVCIALEGVFPSRN